MLGLFALLRQNRIRCEKAALWMQQRGIDHVFQLEGDILRYLQEQPDAPMWRGRCFVFDERGSLDEQLQGEAAPWPGS